MSEQFNVYLVREKDKNYLEFNKNSRATWHYLSDDELSILTKKLETKELADLRKRTEWQPIETIPGRVVVLVYDADYGIIISQDIGGCVIGAKNPTHWMPLPELL